MKLPNFYKFEPLNSLKAKMGIPPDVYGSLTVSVPSRLTEIELEKLTSPEGLDISADDLIVLPDGTLAYKDTRVLAYIRDVAAFGWRVNQPRFHLANCITLQQMREHKKFEKYVASTNMDGWFEVNVIKSGVIKKEKYELPVCQNCLHLLNFDGFKGSWPKEQRNDAVKKFNIESFFKKYPRSLHSQIPKYNSDNAPVNKYSDDWNEKSWQIRNKNGWRCQKCDINLSAEADRKWLHVHHINGLKHDNTGKNLKVLCIGCHAEEPSHAHIRNIPDYIDFLREKH